MRIRSPGTVLAHPVRMKLVCLVRERPGTPFIDAARTIGVGYSTLQYHARVLERHGLLTLARARGRGLLFSPDGAPVRPEQQRALAALARPAGRAVFTAVVGRPDATIGEVARVLGMPRATAQWHLGRLASDGVLRVSYGRHGLHSYNATPVGLAAWELLGTDAAATGAGDDGDVRGWLDGRTAG